MKKELEEALFEEFPDTLDREYLYFPHLECGDGWYDIIRNLCIQIEEYKKDYPGAFVKAVQVKEKFGGLRFYADGVDSTVNDFIEEAECKSIKTCDVCGSKGMVIDDCGWLKTRCKGHEYD